MALFFYWFCCADIWDDCNKLEGVSEATRGQQFYRFKWIFPMWIACLLWLSSNRTTTSQRVTSLTNKKVHFIRTHQEDSEHGIQSPAWDFSWCAQRKKKKRNTMRCTLQFEEPNQDRRSRGVWLQMLQAFFAITNKQESVQRGSLTQSKTLTFIFWSLIEQKGKCFGSEIAFFISLYLFLLWHNG